MTKLCTECLPLLAAPQCHLAVIAKHDLPGVGVLVGVEPTIQCTRLPLDLTPKDADCIEAGDQVWLVPNGLESLYDLRIELFDAVSAF